MTKKKTKIVMAEKEKAVEQPKSPASSNPNELTPEEKAEALMPQTEVTGDHRPSATQDIPAVVERVDKVKESSEDITDNAGSTDAVTENELAFGNFSNKRSMKFDIDPNEIKAPAYAVDDFRGFVEKFRHEKEARPNVLFINTDSLNRLGYRDVAVELGLQIQESTVYKDDELVLALDL